MERVFIADKTLKQTGKSMSLSFREKIELSRLIDRLEVDSIELPPITNPRVDALLIKSISSAVRNAAIAVPVRLTAESVEKTWSALQEAGKARLQISVPVSPVQMEYLYHLKPTALSEKVAETIRECLKYTQDVEFIAEDAFRADRDFLLAIIKEVISAGVTRITFQETAGTFLPEELRTDLRDIIDHLEAPDTILFGIDCSDDMSLADACVVEAVRCGVREIKAASFSLNCADLSDVVQILSLKGEKMGVFCRSRREEIKRVTSQIGTLCRANLHLNSMASGTPESDGEALLGFHDSKESILRIMNDLGYLLSSEDQEKVYQAFLNITEKKGNISKKELEALIASEAMQVPASYSVIRYVVNTGNEIGAMAHMKLQFHDQVLEGVSTGDGAIDAAFLALEKAVGKHFELDDFQIRAITEGREAMGETIVRLRSQGKLYSGRGVSTDIVGSGIMAYLSALNKIVYEEDEQ